MTSAELLTRVKERITVPTSQTLMPEATILRYADDAIKSRIVPLVMSADQNFFVTKTNVPLVAGQSEYAIPYRGIGRKIRELKISDANNNERNLAMIALEDAHMYQSSTLTIGFYFIGDKIRMVPDIPSSISVNMQLEFWWFCPPSPLCTTSSAAQITEINGTMLTCSGGVPGAVQQASAIDIIQGYAGNAIWSFDVVPTAVTSSTVTLASGDVPSDLVVGDYIAPRYQSPVVNWLPNEADPLVVSLTAQRVLKALGDVEASRELDADISEEKQNLLKMIEPRIDGEPEVIINRYSLTRGSKFSQRRWIYGA